MRTIIVHFDNGNSITTQINATIGTVVSYYLDRQFPFEDESGHESMSTARCIEFVEEPRIQLGDIGITLKRVYSLSESYMRRHNLYYRFRVEYFAHYPTGVSMPIECSYNDFIAGINNP